MPVGCSFICSSSSYHRCVTELWPNELKSYGKAFGHASWHRNGWQARYVYWDGTNVIHIHLKRIVDFATYFKSNIRRRRRDQGIELKKRIGELTPYKSTNLLSFFIERIVITSG